MKAHVTANTLAQMIAAGERDFANLQVLPARDGGMVEISSMKFVGVTFDNCEFNGVEFHNCTFTGTTFNECLLIETTFKNCEFMTYSRLQYSRLCAGSVVSECSFDETVTLEEVEIDVTNFINCQFNGGLWDTCTFTKCRIEQTRLGASGYELEIQGVMFYDNHFGAVEWNYVELSSSFTQETKLYRNTHVETVVDTLHFVDNSNSAAKVGSNSRADVALLLRSLGRTKDEDMVMLIDMLENEANANICWDDYIRMERFHYRWKVDVLHTIKHNIDEGELWMKSKIDMAVASKYYEGDEEDAE